ncbi:hypothetical protein GCM10009000_033540 [Halobacterium noricense]
MEVLGDTTDGVTTLDSEDDLRRGVVEHLVHLVVTNNPVTVKSLTRMTMKPLSLSILSKVVLIPAENTWNDYNEFNEQNELNEKNECSERILRNDLAPSAR